MGENIQTLKDKLRREIAEYWANFIYLAIIFSVIATYRRLILASYDIDYSHYGIAVIQAAILAKAIMLGDAFKLGQKLEHHALFYTTLYKTVMFSLWVIVFKICESTVKGLLHKEGLGGGIHEIFARDWHEILANSLIILASFFPFFAFREVRRINGDDKIVSSLFHRSKFERMEKSI